LYSLQHRNQCPTTQHTFFIDVENEKTNVNKEPKWRLFRNSIWQCNYQLGVKLV